MAGGLPPSPESPVQDKAEGRRRRSGQGVSATAGQWFPAGAGIRGEVGVRRGFRLGGFGLGNTLGRKFHRGFFGRQVHQS